jgi:sugar lactone lactonase YvrE
MIMRTEWERRALEQRPRLPARRAVRLLTAYVALSAVLVPLALGPAPAAARRAKVREALEVRSLFTSEFGVRRPAGLAYDAASGVLLVPRAARRGTAVLQLAPTENSRGTIRLPNVNASTLAFDARRNRLTAVRGDRLLSVSGRDLRREHGRVRLTAVGSIPLSSPRGATFDLRTGTWLVLNNSGRSILRVPMPGGSPGSPTSMRPGPLGAARLEGIAFNPSDGLLYVLSGARDLLYGLDPLGRIRATYDLANVGQLNVEGMVFAPSADPTDDPRTTHLYVADAGAGSTLGRVAELSLTAAVTRQAAVAAPTVTATLVQTIHLWQLDPPSPDSAGVTYLRTRDRLWVADSEVDEMTIFKGVNLYQVTRTGSLTNTAVTTSYSKEPTGLGVNPVDETLYVSDDNANRVFFDRPPYGSLDASLNVATFGNDDAEGVEWDPDTGHLFTVDGVAREVFRIDPADGTFGNGNDVVTRFDVEQYGAIDPEGIGIDTDRDLLLLSDHRSKRVYELTKSGALVRTVDISGIPVSGKNLAGVTLAPASDGSGRMNLWLSDRGVDNNQDPNENDGKVYEMSVPGGDTPPAVTLTSPPEGSTVRGTVVAQAGASDDRGVTQVQFAVDGTTIGTDTNGADGWSVSWDTSTVGDGSHTVTATTTDTVGQTGSDSNGVTVDNTAPTVAITSPSDGDTVSLTIPVLATASDNRVVTQVQFLVDGTTSIGTDTNGADGWSVSWNTTATSNGSHPLTAVARDAAGNATTSAPVSVTVDNPATVNLDIPVSAGADDVEERSTGSVTPGSSDLDLVVTASTVQTVGLRFTGVSVPQGATITNAYVQFQTDQATSVPTSLTVQGNAADNASPFIQKKFNVSSRTRTSASVAWSPPAWDLVGERGLDQRTPQLRAVLQEIASRPGWGTGNAMALIITGSGTRIAEAFEGAFAPVLHIEYATG